MSEENKSLAKLHAQILQRMRKVPNFPKEGILFYDFTPVLLDGPTFVAIIDALSDIPLEYDLIAGLDARGFLLASAVSYQRGIGVLAVRKPGKLPPPVLSECYELEYGSNIVEIPDQLPELSGSRILIIDDVLATGGTAKATARLLQRAGAQAVGLAVVLELVQLQGREKFALPVWSLCTA